MRSLKLLPLSSACVENERENVLNHMKYADGYFAFSRTPEGSIPNRFYPTLEEAYRTTLAKFNEVGQFKNSKNIFFSITDNAKSILYRGTVMPTGKIKFSIYDGIEVNKTSTITDELNKISTNKVNTMKKKINLISTVAATTCSKPETNEKTPTLKRNAQVYLDNNILTQSSLDFLCMSEDRAKTLAQLIHETAANNKAVDNQTFTDAIADVSGGMLTITKTLASGKPIADTHVSFHFDSLYCAVHCKSADALWDGSNTWRKVPGKIAYGKIGEVVMDMYHKGQQLLLSPKDATQPATTINQPDMTTEKLSLGTISANIASTVMTYLNCTPDMRHYLTMKGFTFESDLASISNGVIEGTIANGNITLSVLSGQSCEISPSRYTTDEQLRDAITVKVAHLFVGASISGITRDKVSFIVDLATIEDYYINSMKHILSPAA